MSGKKASIKQAVQPTTASAIWPVPLMAAVVRSSPSRRRRAIFSVTTMESSTKRPRARMNPAMDSWLRLNPNSFSTMTPIKSDRGIEIITTSPARKPSGNRVSSTKATAMAKSR